MKRICLFGGTFNPIHNGHLTAAQVVANKLDVDEVIFIPCAQPPHKTISDLVSNKHRLSMVRRAISDNPIFSVSDFELKQGGKSYSIHTARYFKSKYPKAKLYFVIGADALKTLHQWKEFNELRKIVSFVAVNRGGYKIPKVKERVKIITMPELDISSSFLRAHLPSDPVAQYLLPKKVFDYIQKYRLYR